MNWIRKFSKYKKPKKIKSAYVIEKSNEPNDDGNYILWYESETEHGCSFTKVFKGTHKECKLEKEKRLKRRKKYE